MVWKGVRFGMMLQLAIGPVFFLVLTASALYGCLAGIAVMAAAALVDAVFIAISAGGIAVLIKRPGIQRRIKLFGSAVLMLFGLYMTVTAMGEQVPQITFSGTGYGDFFMTGLILTLSNPLTILFWGGVFASQVAVHGASPRQMKGFAAGCVLSTILFLTGTAVVGAVFSRFLPLSVLLMLNGAVGVILLYLGFRLWRT